MKQSVKLYARVGTDAVFFYRTPTDREMYQSHVHLLCRTGAEQVLGRLRWDQRFTVTLQLESEPRRKAVAR